MLHSSTELPQRLTAGRIRGTTFPIARRGYDSDAVRALLNQIADEVLRTHQRLTAAYAENDRIKRALRQWQSDHAATCRSPLTHPTSRG